ncbi:MAG: hypothetical protein U0Q15_15670 [Kineosporiaceae bacterium]
MRPITLRRARSGGARAAAATAALAVLLTAAALPASAEPTPNPTNPKPVAVKVGGSTASTLDVVVPGRAVTATFLGTAGRLLTLSTYGSSLPGSEFTLIGPDRKARMTLPAIGDSFRQLRALDATGRWTLRLTPPSGATGSLSFTLAYAASEALRLQTGAETLLSLPRGGEVQAYTFTGRKGRRPTLTVTRAHWTSDTSDYSGMWAGLYGPDGRMWGDFEAVSGAFPDGYQQWREPRDGLGAASQLPENGTWTLLFGGTNGSYGSQAFRLNQISNQRRELAFDAVTRVAVSSRGQDVAYRFAGEVGKRVVVDLLSATWRNRGVASMALLRPDGTQFERFDRMTEPMPVPDLFESAPLDVPGTWTLLVDPYGDTIGGQVMSVGLIDDPAPVAAAWGTPVTATVAHPGQVASLTVPARPGRRLVLHVSGSSWSSASAGGAPAKPVRVVARSFDGAQFAWADLDAAGSSVLDVDGTTSVPGDWTILVDPQDDAVGSATFTLDSVEDVVGNTGYDEPLDVTVAKPYQQGRYAFSGSSDDWVVYARYSGSTFAPGQVALRLLDADGHDLGRTELTDSPDGVVMVGSGPPGTRVLVVDPVGEATGSIRVTLTRRP